MSSGRINWEDKDMPDKLNNLTKDLISTFIVNWLWINLCAVKTINIDRQEDGQIREIKIEFNTLKD